MLLALSKLFDQNIVPPALQSAVALHGCGDHGDQCGLVEGAVMFIGIYHLERGWEKQDVAKLAYVLAETIAIGLARFFARIYGLEAFQREILHIFVKT